MDRRSFLGLLATTPTLTAKWLTALGESARRKNRAAEAPETHEGVDMSELLARGTATLGKLHQTRFHVSLDNIASPTYLAQIIEGRNLLTISTFSAKARYREGALLRAVLARLHTASPSDYKNLKTGLGRAGQGGPGTVREFHLEIPQETRRHFPVDNLAVVNLEQGPSGSENFSWVPRVFKIARSLSVSNLIVPCLGRNWRDRHTVKFQTFFETILRSTPPGKNPEVFFSLYAQWPSFELQHAVASINAAWRHLAT